MVKKKKRWFKITFQSYFPLLKIEDWLFGKKKKKNSIRLVWLCNRLPLACYFKDMFSEFDYVIGYHGYFKDMFSDSFLMEFFFLSLNKL